jgi:hypothetical protein
MPGDDIKKRFLNEIQLRGENDHFIDRNEEREILQIAIQLGISREAAHSALEQVCTEHGYVLETALIHAMRAQLELTVGDDGQLDHQEFDMIIASAKRATQGKLSDRQLKLLLIQLIEESGKGRVKTGWFSDWFGRLKKDLGMV